MASGKTTTSGGKGGPAKGGPAQTGPTKTGSTQTGSSKTGPAKAGTAKAAAGSGQTPQQKVQAMRRKAARKQRTRKFALIGLIVVIVAGAGTAIGVYYGTREDPLANVQTFTNTRNHTTASVTYAQTPPTGGDHDPTWLNCGIYTEPVRSENAVHDLEHGAVWITYRPDLPQDQIDALQDKVRGQTYETLSPYPDLPAPVVISAWDTQLKLTGVDDPGLDAFIKKYKQGPQTPEPGALCTGGTGTPVG